MFNWLKNLFFGKPAQVSGKISVEVTNEVFEKEAIAQSEAPYVEPAADAPKPKKNLYYKPKAKKSETPAPQPEVKHRRRKGPESK